MPNSVFLILPSLHILRKTQAMVVLISRCLVKSLINKNCHNSRNINDTKLGLVTKTDKRNMTMSKNFNYNDNDVVSANDDVIVSPFFNLWLIWYTLKAGFRIGGL